MVVLGIVAAVLLLGLARVRSAANERKMLAAIERMREVTLRFPHEREAPHGDTTDDRAWPHYLDALAKVQGLRGSRALERKLWRYQLSAEEREGLLAQFGAALPSLRRGAIAGDAKDVRSSEDQIGIPHVRLSDVRTLACLGFVRAEALLEAGDPEEAVRVILDVQQLGADLVGSHVVITEAIGCAYLMPYDWKSLLEGEHYEMLDDASKAMWISGIKRIAAGIPRETRAFRGDLLGDFPLVHGSLLDGTFDRAEYARGRWTRWLPKLVWKSALADFVLRSEALAKELDRAYRLPRPKILQEVRRLMELRPEAQNLFSNILRPKMESLAISRLENLMRLDMLRHALCVESGLPDPLPESIGPTPIQVERRNGQVHLCYTNDRAVRIEITVGVEQR